MGSRSILDGRLKIRHLLLVDALTEQGSVLGAAAALHIAQPVATRALRELEDLLGVTLYERGPRGITPTEFGIALTDHARDVLARLRLASRHLDEIADATSGTVVIGSHLVGASILLPRAIMALKRVHPLVSIEVHEGTPEKLLVDLAAGRLDYVLGRISTPDTEEMEHHLLMRDAICLVVGEGNELARRETLALPDVMGDPWIIPPAGTALRADLEAHLARHGLGLPRNRVETSLYVTIRRLLAETDTLAVVPRRIVGTDPVHVLPIELDGMSTALGVTRMRQRRLSPAAQYFMTLLQEVAHSLEE